MTLAIATDQPQEDPPESNGETSVSASFGKTPSAITGTDDVTKVRCIRCRLIRPPAGGCPYCEDFMYDGPYERFDEQRRWLGFYTRIWKKEPASARAWIICETGAYPDANGAERAAENLVAHFAARVLAGSRPGADYRSDAEAHGQLPGDIQAESRSRKSP